MLASSALVDFLDSKRWADALTLGLSLGFAISVKSTFVLFLPVLAVAGVTVDRQEGEWPEYERMVAKGAFDELRQKIELINGGPGQSTPKGGDFIFAVSGDSMAE